MEMSGQGLELIKQRESCRLTPYQDSVGVWTDGWGNTIGVIPHGLPITQEKADADFARNLENFGAGVNDSLTVPVLQNQFDALLSFAYNIGINGEEHSTLVRVINAGAPVSEIAAQFDRWHIPAEVTTRRNGEKFQFMGTAFHARCDSHGNAVA